MNFSFNNSFKKTYRNLSGQNVGKNSNLPLTSEQVTQNLLRRRKTLLMAPVQAAALTPSQKITMESYMKTIQRQEPTYDLEDCYRDFVGASDQISVVV